MDNVSAYDLDLPGGVSPSAVGAAPSIVAKPVGGAAHASGMLPFDGADRVGTELASWLPVLRSADAEVIPHKDVLDARVRDVGNNDAYVHGGAVLHKDNIVGACFLLNSAPNYIVLGLDDMWADEFSQEVEAKFTLAAESDNKWLDASRMNTLSSMVRLAIGVFAGCGEVLATAEWLRAPGRPFNTAIQMIDPDRLSTPLDRQDGPSLRGGVEKDFYGAPIAYHIREAHPNDADVNRPESAYTWKCVPARKPWGRLQVIHIIEQQRPEQSRGVSELVAALKEIFIARKWRDVTLQNAVVNSLFAATIESELPTEEIYAQLGAQGGDIGSAIASASASYMQQIAEYGESARLKLDGVRIPHFYPGTKLSLNKLGNDSGRGAEFEESLLRYIAAATGVSYEQLSRDYTKTNYSSARAATLETWKFMMSRKRFVADAFASAIFRLWLEEAFNKKLITSLPRNAPSMYEGLNFDAYAQCSWIGAARGQIDEEKETKAAVLRMQNNLSTLEDECNRHGKDWRVVLRQRKREKDELESLGLDAVSEAQAMTEATSDKSKDQPEDEDA